MFNINTILTKKVQIYLEAMINYRIAVTLHARETMWCHFVLTTFHFHEWYYYCHEFILDWFCVHSHSWTQTLCTKQGMSDLRWHQFCSCHDVSVQVSSVKAGRQQTWVRWQEFVQVIKNLLLTELSSSSLLNYIASPKNLPFRCCVIAPVRHFDQQHL